MKHTYDIGGMVFGKWHIERKVGAGNFGTVYEIRRKEFGETYTAALKVITVPQGETEFQDALDEGMTRSQAEDYFYTMVKDIVQEFAIMAKLKGTGNVVSYEDHEVVPHEGGGGWDILIRMELLNPLMPYAYDHPLSRRDVIQLGIDLCRALELCQKYNIIHRDIKPENIFVSDNGDFKLGDFGIARTIERTMSGLSKKGTYNYMAPEIYRGSEYGFSVDIYSLGIVLYRLLNNNRAPFLPQPPAPITYTQRETALAKRMGGEELPAPVNGQGRLGEIVLRACAFDPKARYSSPLQMRQELEAIQYGPEDGKIIYPSGDELVLYENQYISRRTRDIGGSAAGAETFTSGAGEAIEKTESVFGGAMGRPAPEKTPEEFLPPAGKDPEGSWPAEATEKTESVFGRGVAESEAADLATSSEEKSRKTRLGVRLTAIIAVILMLTPLFLGALWVLGYDVFGSGSARPADTPVGSSESEPAIPESLREYEAAGTLERQYSDNETLCGYTVRTVFSDGTGQESDFDLEGIRTASRFYSESGELEREEIYNQSGLCTEVRQYNEDGPTISTYYDDQGKMTRYELYDYDDQEKMSRCEGYDADGVLTGYLLCDYDDQGNLTHLAWYDADGALTQYAELDASGSMTFYQPDGTPQ